MRHQFAFGHVWLLGSLTLFLSCSNGLSADPVATTKLPTVTYDVGDLLAKRTFWDLGELRTKPPPLPEDAADGFTRSILEALIADSPRLAEKFRGKDATFSIQLVYRKNLEVRADAATQAQVKSLLAVFRGSLDLAVVVESRLYEVDREAFDKRISPKLPRRPGNPPVFADPATEATERKVLQGKAVDRPFYAALKPLQTSKVAIQDREHGEVFSLKMPISYERSATRIFQKKESAIANTGFSFTLTPTVVSDRRSTQIKLTQKVTQLVEWQKVKAHELLANQKSREVSFEVPVLQESSFTSTFEVLDGWPVVVPVQWQRPGARDRQLVLVFTPSIRIEEEERAIKAAEDEKNREK